MKHPQRGWFVPQPQLFLFWPRNLRTVRKPESLVVQASRCRTCVGVAVLGGIVAASWTGFAGAAELTTSILAQVESGGRSVFEQGGSRSYVFDGLLFAVLVGAAIFVICRSSRRS